MADRRDAFFLGSGVSTGIAPSTGMVTDVVFNRLDEHYLGIDEQWRRIKPGAVATQRSEERRDRVGVLLQDLRQRIDRFYANRDEPTGCRVRSVNYEDIGFMADALLGTLTFERDDPGIAPLIEQVVETTRLTHQELAEGVDDTLNYLRDVLHASLAPLKPTPGHLRAVADACAQAAEAIPIYTLNHDCLIEGVLDNERVPFEDFMRAQDERRVLAPLAIPRENCRATLYKLHGSVNWRRFRRANGSGGWFSEWIGDERSTAGQLHHNGSTWRSLERPLILLGRFNKELGYLDQPFLDLMSAFTQSLRSRDRLFVSGYGFGDKAVNSMLIEWVYSARGKRLIVLHEREHELLDAARGAICQRWQEWKDEGVLTVIPKFLGDCRWEELKTIH